jgi:hypothetical protein
MSTPLRKGTKPVWQNIHPTWRGIWLCPQAQNRVRGWWTAPNSEAARRGFPQQATQGCGYWNVYVALPKTGTPMRGGLSKKEVDTKCKHCGRRVRFQLSRHEKRGRPRAVLFQRFPVDTPLEALIDCVQTRNGHELNHREIQAFTKAKDYKNSTRDKKR